MPKKRIIQKKMLEEIANKYLANKKEFNLAKLSESYDIPYSTLRRYLLSYLKESDLESVEDFLPYEGFEYLSIGDTYQWDYHLTVWLIVEIRNMDGDKVFVLIPSDNQNKRHWVCDELQGEV